MRVPSLSASTSSTNSYKGTVSFNGKDGQNVFSFQYTTTGTLTGTLHIDASNSDLELIQQDIAGGTNYTDKAVWYPLPLKNDVTGVTATSIAISGAGGDVINLSRMNAVACRPRYVNATNTGTVTVTSAARRA